MHSARRFPVLGDCFEHHVIIRGRAGYVYQIHFGFHIFDRLGDGVRLTRFAQLTVEILPLVTNQAIGCSDIQP